MNKNLWWHCLDVLKKETLSQQFSTYIKPLRAEMLDKELLIIAPNSNILSKLKDDFITKIEKIVKLKSGSNAPKITLIVERRKDCVTNKQPEPDPLKFHSDGFNPKLTFERFIVGESNLLAEAASRHFAENLSCNYNPLFIHGETGLGKTHLVNAIGNSIIKNNPQATILYKNSEEFVSGMVQALQNAKIGQFKQFCRGVDALILEDIQFFSKKDRSQEELLHTINSLLENKRQVILTCDQPLNKIKGLNKRLKSRLGSGLPVAIGPPDFETRMSILTDKAQQEGYKLPPEVLFILANEIHGDIRELESALRLVIAYSLVKGEEITLISTHKALGN